MWYITALTLTLRRLGQEDCHSFQASLGCTACKVIQSIRVTTGPSERKTVGEGGGEMGRRDGERGKEGNQSHVSVSHAY